MVDSGLSYTGSTSALGADRLGSIPSSPTNLNIANFAGSWFARLPRLFFGGIGGRISQSEMRRQRGCCPCPNPPVRGQRQGTPFIFVDQTN